MLRVLDAVARQRSLSGAAERVCMTQSGVSHAIRSLEKTVGGALLSRDRTGVHLTELGRQALGEAQTALAAVDRLCELSGTNSPAGLVRIALVPSAASRLAPAFLHTLRKKYPLIEVELLEGTDQEVSAWIKDGVADLCVTGEKGGTSATLLTEDPLVLVAPVDDPLLEFDAVELKMLDQRAFVMSASGCEPMLRRLFKAANIMPDVRLSVKETTSLLAIVGSGIGISVLPRLAIPTDGWKGVNIRAFEPRLSRQLYLLQKSGESTPAADVAATVIAAEFSAAKLES